MKRLFSFISVAFLLTACGGKGSTEASADSHDTKDNSKTSQYPCNKSLEGVVAYLNKEKVAYICQNEYWVDYEDEELFSKLENAPACTDTDKIAVIAFRTSHTTIVCHDRD